MFAPLSRACWRIIRTAQTGRAAGLEQSESDNLTSPWLAHRFATTPAAARARWLDRTAALGPRFRVGLPPSPDTTRGNFTDEPSLSANGIVRVGRE
jgi:hypothetical protein